MKSRSLLIVTVLLLLTVAFTTSVLGQGIVWKTPGVLVDSEPGKATACSLRFFISTGNHLVQGDWIKIDLSNFQVKETQADNDNNYSFVSTNSSETIHMEADDFDADYNATTQELTITLNGENALFPSDTAKIRISKEVLVHKGKGPNEPGSGNDVNVRLKTSKQPVYVSSSQTTTISLDDPLDRQITSITRSDSNAYEYSYYTINLTTNGRIPALGKFKIKFPSGYSFNESGTDTADVHVTVGGVEQTLSSVTFSDSDPSVTIAVEDTITDGASVEIKIGKTGNLVVRNPSIHPYSSTYYQNYDFSTGTEFIVYAMDEESDTLFYDKSGSDITYRIVSNYWQPDSDSGGVTLSVQTAGKSTELSVRFKVGSIIDSVTTSDVDTLYLDLSAFKINVENDKASDDRYYTIYGAVGMSDSSGYNATYKGDSVVAITPGPNAYIPVDQNITIVVSSTLLENYGQTSDITVKVKSSHQDQWLDDRDVTKIFANTGGVITTLHFSNYEAGEYAMLDSLKFTTDGEIPQDGYIVVKFPSQFTLASSIDSAFIFGEDPTTGARVQIANAGEEISSITTSVDEIKLKLNLSSAIPSDSILIVQIGDSTGYNAHKSFWTSGTYAFTNPAPADSGTYPDISESKDNIIVETRYANESVIQTGTNSAASVRIVTNYILPDSFGVTYGDGDASSVSHIRSHSPSLGAVNDSVWAGDSVGIWLKFTLGSDLIGKGGLDRDTFYVDFSDFIVNPMEAADTNNYDFTGDHSSWAQDVVYIGSGVVGITHNSSATDPDTLFADRTIEFKTAPKHQVDDVNIKRTNAGLLTAKGSGQKKVTIWTNRQSNNTLQPSNYILVNADTLRIFEFTSTDSTAYEDALDTLRIGLKTARLNPGYTIKFTLKEGFTWNTSNVSVSNMLFTSSGGLGAARNSYGASEFSASVSGQVLTVTLSDTVKPDSANGFTAGGYDYTDTLLFAMGTSTAKFVKNTHPDSIFGNGYGRARRFQGYDYLNKKYRIDIYDDNNNLAFTNYTGDESRVVEDSVNVVTNSLSYSEYSIRQASVSHPAEKAGELIDTLVVPIYIGEPVVGGSITFEFSGVSLNDSAITATGINGLTEFRGDTSGVNTRNAVTNNFSANNQITYNFESGDSLGGGHHSDIAYFLVEARFAYMFRNLGASGGSDDITVKVSTSTQSTQVQDTTDIALSFFDNNDATVSGSLNDNSAGTATSHTYTLGATHAYLEPNSIIKVNLPIKSSEFLFTSGISDGADISSYVLVDTGSTPYRDTLTIGDGEITSITYSATSDTGSIKIILNSAEIDEMSPINIILTDDIFTNPERDTQGNDVTGIFAYNGTLPTSYNYSMHLLDSNENALHKTNSTYNITAGSLSKILLLWKGETFNPGDTDGKAGSAIADTVGTDIDFAIIPTDNYYNRVVAGSDVLVTLTSTDENAWIKTSSVTPFSPSGSYTIKIDPDNATATKRYYIRSAYSADADSFKFLTAADENSNLGRNSKHYLTATTTGGVTSTVNSSEFKVYPSTMAKVIGLFPSQTSYYAPGDTVNDGIDPAASTPQLAQYGTYTLTAYTVDNFYNRVDTTDALYGSSYGYMTLGASLTTGSNVEITPKSTYTDAYGKQEFSVKSTATATSNVITVSSSDLGSSADYAITFNVVAATATADFTVGGTYTLADSTSDYGAELEFKVKLTYSGSFGDLGWKFYVFPDSDETSINPSEEGVLDVNEGTYIQKGSGGTAETHTDTVDTRNLIENQKYFIYAVLPQQGNTVVAQSKGFVVKHWPWVATDSLAITPSAANDTVNSSSGNVDYTIKYKVIDYNSANIPVQLYISSSSSLTRDDLILSGEYGSYTVSGLGSATRILSSSSFTKNDTTATLSIANTTTDSVIISKGNYYVYVVANDKYHQDVAKSDYMLTVKHGPAITLDRPVAGTTNIDTRDQKYITVNWSKSGDSDLDDNATIAIYYDTTTKNYTLPNSLINSSTAVQLTNGFELYEDDDNESDQYIVNLSALSSSNLPIAGGKYDFYALIRDNVDTVLARSPGDVQFTHSPKFEFKFNFGGPSTSKASGANLAKQVKINKGDVYRVTFDAYDLDDDEYIRLVISQLDNADYDDFTFGTDAWILNSTNGSPGNNGANVITLTTDDTYYNWDSGDMSGLSNDGNYYLYAFVTTNGRNSESYWNNTYTDKFTAEGRINITGTDGTNENYSIHVVPSVVSTNVDDTIRFEVYINTKNEEVENISFFLNVDTTLFDVVDQGNGAHIKPFGYGTGYFTSGSVLEDTALAAGDDKTLWLNFRRYYSSGITTSDDSAIVYFDLVSKGTDSVTTVDNSIYFVQDATNDRLTALADDGEYINTSLPNPAIKFYTNPLGMITGVVPLEGRTNFAKEVTFELREPGKLLPISDSRFENANDQNATVSGVQITTDRDGYYELTNVPTGTYNLIVKTDSYISGQYKNISVVPGDLETSINPTYDNSATPVDNNYLLGGDCASQDANFIADNVVSTEDVTCITLYFGSTESSYSLADINGSGKIDEADLFIAAKNLNEEGVPPVFYKEDAGTNAGAEIELVGIPEVVGTGTEFEVDVMAKNVDDLFGYAYTLIYDESKVELVDNGISEGRFLTTNDRNANTIFFTKDMEGGKKVVSSLLGQRVTATGTGVITTLKFKTLDNERPDIRLLDAKLANSQAQIYKLGDIVDVPDEFGLRQNYPNPFNPETNISFKLPHSSRVTLKVYNILGQEITTLVNRNMDAGYHNIKWDGRNSLGIRVASGIYIYRLRAGDFTKSLKMVLLK